MPVDGVGGGGEVGMSSQVILNSTSTVLQGGKLHFLGEIQPP